MTPKELASRINGREYLNELTSQDEKDAADNMLVIAFGASDDLLELRGALHDESGAYNGGVLKFRLDKMRFVKDDDCPDCLAKVEIITIKAEWCPEDLKTSWRITTNIPFEPFDMMEDGELYCRGAIFELRKTL